MGLAISNFQLVLDHNRPYWTKNKPTYPQDLQFYNAVVGVFSSQPLACLWRLPRKSLPAFTRTIFNLQAACLSGLPSEIVKQEIPDYLMLILVQDCPVLSFLHQCGCAAVPLQCFEYAKFID